MIGNALTTFAIQRGVYSGATFVFKYPKTTATTAISAIALVIFLSKNFLLQKVRGIQGCIVIYAAKCGYTNIVNALIATSDISTCDLEATLVRAAKDGATEIVDQLLQKSKISTECRKKAILCAADSNHEQLVVQLLTEEVLWSVIGEYTSGDAVKQRVFAFLPEGVRGQKIIRLTARVEDYDRLKALLESGPISQENRGKAICSALKAGNLETAKKLGLTDDSLSQENRGKAIIVAAKKGYEDIVRQLLDKGRIDESHQKSAIFGAIEGANLGIAERLLQVNLHTVEKYRAYAIVWALMHLENCDNVVESLLKNGQISEVGRHQAIQCAMDKNCIIALKALLKSGSISILWQFKVISAAIDKSYDSGIVEKVLAIRPIEERHCLSLVEKAVKSDRVAIVTTLLEKGGIADGDKAWAIVNLAEKLKDQAIIQQLVTSVMVRSYALEIAARKGCATVVANLLANGEIEKLWLKDSMEIAQIKDHTEVLKIFDKYKVRQTQLQTVQRAIESKDISQVKTLLREYAFISWQTLELLILTIEHNNLDAIKAILQSNQYMTPEDFGTALEQAAASKNTTLSYGVFKLVFSSTRFHQPPFFQKIAHAFPLDIGLELASIWLDAELAKNKKIGYIEFDDCSSGKRDKSHV